MFIATVTLSKISLLVFISRLIPSSTTVTGARVLMAVAAAWGIASVIALSFQCSLPEPWNITTGTCRNQAALYFSSSITDIVIDFAITVLPVVALWNVQIQRAKRAAVMAVFIVRIRQVSDW